ncbi:MAG TPA: DUF4432 family protein [Candidatus Latescibacteria bacterium]|nr:DUF4432 family protein [Candidatus Latescibacterota bacterium]
MPVLFGRNLDRRELMRRVGDIWQVGGVREVVLGDGTERGVRAAEFRTGTGLEFTVLLDRAMDVAEVRYKGYPLAWVSPTGFAAPSFFEPEGLGWLRTFGGGMLTTCGLTYLGEPCEDEGKSLGLHGRISHIPARGTWVDGEWEGRVYRMWAQGKVREAMVFGENLELSRRVWARLGESRFFVEDEVVNLGFEPSPFMILYHINVGYPVVDEGSRLIAPSRSVRPRDEEAAKGLSEWNKFQSPASGFKEQVFYHDMAEGQDGYVTVALVNQDVEGRPLGVYVRYHREQLDKFVEWKMMGEGTYVVGLEPANCWVEGRAEAKKRGELLFLNPMERRRFHLEIGVVDSEERLAEIESRVRRS